MTAYADLSFFEYTESPWAFSTGFPFILVNVGWIEDKVPSCEVPLLDSPKRSLTYHLGEYLKYPVNLYRGHHTCRMCGFTTYDTPGETLHQGNGEIFVRGPNNIVYVAPTMILHYVDAHGYVPPSGFVTAVTTTSTMEAYHCFHDLYEAWEAGCEPSP